jgi:AcrR family transcriptional regulator
MDKLQNDKCCAIMTAALELVAVQGFHGTPISQIAKQADVGVGSIYRYFADKDELIHAIHARLDERMNKALSQGADTSLPSQGRFIQLVINLIQHLVDNPLEFKFLEQYYNSPFGIEKKREKFLEENVADSDIDKPFLNILFNGRGKTIKDLPKPLIHALAFGPVIFLVRDHLAGLIELDEKLISQTAKGCWDAIKI